ncbi:hypothetical protein SLS61_005255 [Didymella pomorum]
MEQTFQIQVANLVNLIESKYISTKTDYRPVDLAQKLQFFTLDVISDLVFGKPLGCLQHDKDPYDYVEAMDASMPVLASLGDVPWLASLFHSPILRRFLPSEKDKAEIEDGISKATISAPIKDSEARQLPYLQAVIKEGLRVRSPAGGAFYKIAPPGGDMIKCFFVPGGTQVGVSHLGFHSEEVFGPDAQIFKPERWLDPEIDLACLNKMNSTLDMIFHSGKYQCLGKSVALVEFNKIFAESLEHLTSR